jgi:hypothetical protein
MWVIESGSDLDFTEKPLASQGNREFFVEYFDGNWAVVFEILCEIHGRHASAADLPRHFVPVC